MPESVSLSTEELLQIGFQYAYALTHHYHDAEDLVQAAWLKLHQRYKEATTKALFFTIIRNLYVDQYRRRQRIRFIALTSEHERSLVSGDTVREDSKIAMDQMLAKLRDIEREALFLHVVEGYSANEIATLTGRPRGTVLSLIHRSRKKLAALDTVDQAS